MKRTSPGFVVLAMVSALLLLPGSSEAKQSSTAAGPPADYTLTRNLSQPVHTNVVRDVYRVPAFDGEELYIEVVRPAGDGRYPVILEASPYHGTLADRDGTRILPEPRDADGNSLGLTGYFAPRGYAVVMMDLRGTGRSEGCLDHLGPKDAKDLKQIIEWAGAQPWSNGRVGMTGHSYVGSTPMVAAAQNPPSLKTIVPSAGLASMYDHQFQAGVPYFLQWAGPIEAYEQLALERKLPPLPDPFGFGLLNTGDDFGNNVEDTGCGLPNSAAVAGADQLSGRYADWHLARDHNEGATDWDGPIFLVHGVNDNAARVSSMQWFSDRGGRPGDKLWLGQWDHGSGCCPTRRGIQWTYALHAWFDKHLAGRKVKTGPPVEIFLSDGTFEGARTGDRTEIMTAKAWPGTPRMLSFHPDARDGSLSTDTPDGAGSTSFSGDPSLYLEENGQGGAAFRSAPLTDDLVLAGVPELSLSASVSVPRVHLIANLYDEAPDGNRRRITQCALNPELRNGIARYDVVTPGERYDMAPPCFAMAHHLREGHRLVMRVSTADPDKVPLFAVDPNVTVFTGEGATRVAVPVVDDPALYADDVPFQVPAPFTGPAAAPIDETVTTAAVGAPARIPEVTSQYIEFTIPANSDTAGGTVTATVTLPADIDLFVQRQLPDGQWGTDIATGGSSSLSGETMSIERRLVPGETYRIEIHNWAGPPGNEVRVQAVFRNSAGTPGGQ